MTNRIFTRPTLDLTTNLLHPSFSFSGERFLAYCSDLDQKLLQLEQQAISEQVLKPDSNVVTDQNTYECRIAELELPTFDASGFEADFEIDVRWI